MARFWYVYDGMGSPFLISSYNLSPIKPTCLIGCRVCAIYAPSGAGSPAALSTNIRSYIINMLASPVPQPAEPVGAKIYVYGRSC